MLDEFNQKIETLEPEETASRQVREQIGVVINEAQNYLEINQIKECISALEDASEYAYQQANVPGFEDLDSVSSNIENIVEKLQQLPNNN